MQPWLQLLVVEPGELERVGAAVRVGRPSSRSTQPSPCGRTCRTRAATSSAASSACATTCRTRPTTSRCSCPAFDEDGIPGPRRVRCRSTTNGRSAPASTARSRTSRRRSTPPTSRRTSAGSRSRSARRTTRRSSVRGALTGIHDTSDPPPPPAATARLAALLDFDPDGTGGFDADGRRYVRPPDYGEAWLAHVRDGAPAGGWVAQLNKDPTHRVVGGLGLQAGVDLQDEIAGAAADRFGATAIANQRLAALGAGLAVGRSLLGPADRPAAGGRAADRRARPRRRARARQGTGRRLDPTAARARERPRPDAPAGALLDGRSPALRPNAARLRHAKSRATELLDDANVPRPTVRRPDEAPGRPALPRRRGQRRHARLRPARPARRLRDPRPGRGERRRPLAGARGGAARRDRRRLPQAAPPPPPRAAAAAGAPAGRPGRPRRRARRGRSTRAATRPPSRAYARRSTRTTPSRSRLGSRAPTSTCLRGATCATGSASGSSPARTRSPTARSSAWRPTPSSRTPSSSA